MSIATAQRVTVAVVLLSILALLAPTLVKADNPSALQGPEDLQQKAVTCSEGTACNEFAIESGKDILCYNGTCRSNTCVGSTRSVLFQYSLTKVNDCAESPAACVNGSIQSISPNPADWKPINGGKSCSGSTPDSNLCTAPQCVGTQCIEANVADNTNCGTTQAEQCKTTTFGCVNGTCQAQVVFQTTSTACTLTSTSARTGPCDPAPACDGMGACAQAPARSLCCGNGVVEPAAGEECEGSSASCSNCKCIAQTCPTGQTWSMASCSCVTATATPTFTPSATPTLSASSTPTPTPTPNPKLLAVTVSASSPYQLRKSGTTFAAQSNFTSSAIADLATSPNRVDFSVGPACNLDNLTVTWTSKSATVCYLQSSPIDPNANNKKVGTSGSLNVGLLSSSRQYAVQCFNSLNQTVTAAVIINLTRPANWTTNQRWEMSAALGAPNANDSMGILAQDKANPANTSNMIYTNLKRACTNLGYDTYDGGRVNIYYGGFSSPSNNYVCWVVTPRPASGSDIACMNAQTAGDPDYIGGFTCICSP